MSDKYIKHVGRCFLFGKAAVVYEKDDGRQYVIGETCGGRKISAPKPVPEGGFPGDGASKTQAALRYLGVLK